MKKIFTFLCAAMMCAGMVNAKLIFQESFDGKNGTVGQLSAGATNSDEFFNGGSYEQTRWWTYSGSSNYIKVEEGSLSFKGYQSTGLGNKAYLWSTGADDVRSFSSSAVTSGKVYLAAIINVDALKQKADADYFMCLGDHANSKFLGRLYTKSVKEEDAWVGFKFGISKNNESTTFINYTEDVYEPNKDILVVIEYEFVSGDNNDIVRLYVNPSKSTTEPTIECVQSILGGYDNSEQGAISKEDAGIYGIFGAFLRQGTNTPKVYVDEIKIATAWSDLWVEGEGEEEEETINKVDNIAALKAYTAYQPAMLKTQPVIINFIDENLVIQDESGAIILNDFSEFRYLQNAKVGDKIDSLSATPIESNKFIKELATARISKQTKPKVVSSGNSVEPFEVSLAEVTKYGPAWVQLREVEFVGIATKFDVGLKEIKKGQATADLNVPNGCDIIGEDIPGMADVKALVVEGGNSVRVEITASADVTNRKAKGGDETGIQNTEYRSQTQKVIRNGQLVIIRGNKMFNALGAEL